MNKKKMASLGISCTICADSYEDSTDICSTRCGHIYHMSCLQQWINKSDTCPICNQNHPEPHRIYLDIDIIHQPTILNTPLENDDRENTVVLKGVKPGQVTTPLYTFIHQLIALMQVNITENDIKDICKRGTKGGNISIQVSFKTKNHKDLFLQQKHRLKMTPETLDIQIHELINKETEAIFQYTSSKLKNYDYKIIYVENNRVFVKKDHNSQPIVILSKDQVDSLCVQPVNYGDEGSAVNFENNYKMIEESEALFKYSQKLKNYGYEINFVDNKVYADRTSEFFSTPINISSKSQVEYLCVHQREEASTSSSNNRNQATENYERNPDHLNNVDEAQAIFQYSQKLRDFGYIIILDDNNKVYVDKDSDYFYTPMNISSKNQVDNLIQFENTTNSYQRAQVERYTHQTNAANNNQRSPEHRKSNDKCQIL